MAKSDIVSVSKKNIMIASHTHNHYALELLDEYLCEMEILKSRDIIKNISGEYHKYF